MLGGSSIIHYFSPIDIAVEKVVSLTQPLLTVSLDVLSNLCVLDFVDST